MNTDEFIFAVIDHLNERQEPYMVVGSLATNFYCVPRSTQDADVVVQSALASLAREIANRHPLIRFDPQLAFESVTATQKAVLELEDGQFQIELFRLGPDEHDRARFSRRRQVEITGHLVWIASLEDMIITKLRWSQQAGREKDISDLRNLIAVQSQQVDWPYVESWCDRHGTRELLERLRQECVG